MDGKQQVNAELVENCKGFVHHNHDRSRDDRTARCTRRNVNRWAVLQMLLKNAAEEYCWRKSIVELCSNAQVEGLAGLWRGSMPAVQVGLLAICSGAMFETMLTSIARIVFTSTGFILLIAACRACQLRGAGHVRPGIYIVISTMREHAWSNRALLVCRFGLPAGFAVVFGWLAWPSRRPLNFSSREMPDPVILKVAKCHNHC